MVAVGDPYSLLLQCRPDRKNVSLEKKLRLNSFGSIKSLGQEIEILHCHKISDGQITNSMLWVHGV